MIQITVEEVRGLDDLKKEVQRIPQYFDDSAADAYQATQPLYDNLITPPRERSWPGDYPLEWTSLAQKRAVKAKLRREGNYPYVRRHEIRQSWFYAYRREAYKATYDLGNTNPSAIYLYGSMDKDTPGLRQQRFHALTGWPKAVNTADELEQVLPLEIVRGLEERLAKRGLWTNITYRKR